MMRLRSMGKARIGKKSGQRVWTRGLGVDMVGPRGGVRSLLLRRGGEGGEVSFRDRVYCK